MAKLRGDVGHEEYDTWSKEASAVAAREVGLPKSQQVLRRIMPLETAVATIASGVDDVVAAHSARLKTDAKASEHPAIDRHVHAIRDAFAGPYARNGAALKAVRGEIRNLEVTNFDPQKKKAAAANFGDVVLQQRIAQVKLLEGQASCDRAAQTTPSWKSTGATYLRHLKTVSTAMHEEAPPKVPDHGTGDMLDQAFHGVFHLPGLTISWSRGVSDCGLRTVSVTGTATSQKDADSILPGLTDPCGWVKNLPQTFRSSYQTEDLQLARVTDTPVEVAHTVGNPWKGNLYEVAGLQIVPSTFFTEFRNLLNISFSKTPKGGGTEISLAYSLYESLTSAVFGIQSTGGIDADSGGLTVTVDGKAITMNAHKSIRFSPAAPFSDALNVVALPWLSWWMNCLVVGGLTLGVLQST